MLPARDGFDAVRRQVPVRYSIRGGRLLAETVPAQTTVFLEQAGSGGLHPRQLSLPRAF